MQIRAIICVLGGALYSNVALADSVASATNDTLRAETISRQSVNLSEPLQLRFLMDEQMLGLAVSPEFAQFDGADIQLDLRRSPDQGSQSFGLRVRLDEMDQRDRGARNGWFLFLGTDNEAITWSNSEGQDVELRDHATVGDVHVGVSFPTIGGQASLGYARRNVSYSSRLLSADVEEDMFGLSYGFGF
ncbi:MAG: hypothetical protein AAFO63_01610 [Pseudomonadota bacterium]